MPELSDPIWLADLGFLVDITQHLNALLLSQKHLSQVQINTTHFPSLQESMTSFPKNNISAQMKRYAAGIPSLVRDFNMGCQDFAAIETDITLFPPLSPWTLMMPQTTCNWSSLSCSVTPTVAVTNSSLLSTSTASWMKSGSKRFEHLLRKCWACLAQHTCARRHSRLWTLPRAVWRQGQVTLTCMTCCASKPLILSQSWTTYCIQPPHIFTLPNLALFAKSLDTPSVNRKHSDVMLRHHIFLKNTVTNKEIFFGHFSFYCQMNNYSTWCADKFQ